MRGMSKYCHILIVAVFVLISAWTSSFAGNNAGGAFSTWPDTGQTKCYDNIQEIPCPAAGQSFHGQDAQYSGPARSYTLLGGGTMVQDNVTGLVWEMKNSKDGVKNYSNPNDADNTYSWCDPNPYTNGGNQGTCTTNDMADFLDQLNSGSGFSGYTDWRMPTIKELASLVDFGRINPAIDTMFIATTQLSPGYWSSTTISGYPSIAWLVSFNVGFIWDHNAFTANKDYPLYVRAVRGGQSPPENRFVDNNDDTVTDTATCLQWQKATMDTKNDAGPDTYTWPEAMAVSEGLSLAGHADWRLPDINELHSLVDFSRYFPNIDPIFEATTQSYWYWSSTTYPGSSNAYLVHFYYGYDSLDKSVNKSLSYYVRAVRGGQCANAIPQLAITQTPMSGPPGTNFVQQGTGFTPGSIATLHFKKPDGSEYPTKQVTISAGGHFENEYQSAFDMLPGTYRWWAVEGVSGRVSNQVAYEVSNVGENFIGLRVNLDSPPQHVWVDFNVSITAFDQYGQNDTSVNQTVQLKSNAGSGSVSEPSINLSNGQWTGKVKLYAGGDNLRLEACHNGVCGKSPSFSLPPIAPEKGGVTGTFKDSFGQPINGRVTITLQNRSELYTGGSYKLLNVKPGIYSITAYDETSQRTEALTGIYIPPGPPLVRDIVFSLGQSNDKYPILLLAGIMGSASEDNGGPFPGMPPSQGEDGSKLKLHNPTVLGFKDNVGWDKLTTALNAKGYSENSRTLFKVPYDWRMDINAAVETYLKPAITNAKEQSGKDKVSIIAHSMGGLVARAYIQGDHGYQDEHDIHRFAMVGTPNKGSSTTYYLWEGGDPLLADNIVKDGPWIKNFYLHTTQKNSEIALGFTPPSWFYDVFRSYYHGKSPNRKGERAPITGLQQLLPTYGFLGHSEQKPLTVETNAFLYDLNEGRFANGKNFMGKSGSAEDKINTAMFYGSQKDNTIHTIDVGASNNRYVDGQPKPIKDMQASAKLNRLGDGTVLKDSARLPCDEDWAECLEKEGSHSSLIKEFADELAVFIDEGVVLQQSTLKAFAAADAAGDEQSSGLSVSVRGGVRPYLVDPNSSASGIDPSTGDRINTIADTEMTLLADGGFIAMPNPIDGSYQLLLTGAESREYTIELSFTDGISTTNVKRMGFNNGDTTEVLFSLANDAAEKLFITDSFPSPTELLANISTDGQKNTLLTWQFNGLSPSEYRIYSKMEDEPRFALLGTSTTQVFDTGHSWAENSTIPTRVYYVAAVDQNGKESFFSNSALNNDRDHDGLSDEYEVAFGASMTLPDTDGDGLTDYQEYEAGTLPTVIDTDEDGYSDLEEVTAGSDPLEHLSIPRPSDLNSDGLVDLSDVILALQVASGQQPAVVFKLENDANGDWKVGIAEVIYALQKVAGLR